MLSNVRLYKKNKNFESCCPCHIAIIMDGNGRWAKNKGKMRLSGHKEGIKALKRAVIFAVNNKINILTLYAFSSENWNRPDKEVKELMKLFFWVLDDVINSLNKMHVRLRVIGDISKFDFSLQKRIQYAEHLTKNNKGLMLNIAANYGGRWDIIRGFKQIAKKLKKGLILPDQIQEDTLSQYLCLSDLKPVDLVIRTGGEFRISNFLLWQIAYSEFYFTDVLWPDFDERIFKNAINDFLNRDRRFGGLSDYVYEKHKAK